MTGDYMEAETGKVYPSQHFFDQFRALPREHTFDANAATAFDWLTVPGVTRAQAERLTRGASYKDLDAVVAAAEGDPLLQERVRMMSRSMDDLRVRATQEEESLSVTVLLMPFLSRLAGVLLVTSIVAAWLARVAGARRWWTAGLVGAAASSIIILFAWLVTAPPWYPGLAPVVVLGSPLAIFRGLREHSWRAAVSAWRIWGASSLPAVLVSGLLW